MPVINVLTVCVSGWLSSRKSIINQSNKLLLQTQGPDLKKTYTTHRIIANIKSYSNEAALIFF